ncbi:MAG: hypothetical protein V1837_01955 [Candidatus Woesearchaeota archaeon]
MLEREKEHGFMDVITGGLGYIAQIISASVFPHIAEGAEMVMKTIDDRIIRIEKRIIRKMYSFVIIGFGGVLLIFALFSYLREFLRWSNTAAYFSIGIIVFVIGLLLKIGESDR